MEDLGRIHTANEGTLIACDDKLAQIERLQSFNPSTAETFQLVKKVKVTVKVSWSLLKKIKLHQMSKKKASIRAQRLINLEIPVLVR